MSVDKRELPLKRTVVKQIVGVAQLSVLIPSHGRQLPAENHETRVSNPFDLRR